MYQRLISATKTLFFSVTGGLIIATILHGVALSVGNRTLSGLLLWQDTLFVYLAGPGPLLFVDKQGTPWALLIPECNQWINFGCALCWDVARKQRGDDHTKPYCAKCNRICRRDFKQQSGH